MNPKKIIKATITKSSLHRLTKEIETVYYSASLSKRSDGIIDNRTIYCVSPYKTGTTFLSSCYDRKVSRHEPLHYLTLKSCRSDFDSFFIRRLNTLNLKLETSGFWSSYIDKLANHEIAKDLNYICIFRSPSSWITSVINYWQNHMNYMSFDFINEYFWKHEVGVDLVSFSKANTKDQYHTIDRMIEFYFEYTIKTKQLKNIYYLDISEIESFIGKLDILLNEKSTKLKRWKRTNRNKTFQFSDEKLDMRYTNLISDLTDKEQNNKSIQTPNHNIF